MYRLIMIGLFFYYDIKIEMHTRNLLSSFLEVKNEKFRCKNFNKRKKTFQLCVNFDTLICFIILFGFR